MDYAFRSFYSGDPDYMKAGCMPFVLCFTPCIVISPPCSLFMLAIKLSFVKTSCAGASLGRGTGRLAAHVINFQAVNALPPLPDASAGALHSSSQTSHGMQHER